LSKETTEKKTKKKKEKQNQNRIKTPEKDSEDDRREKDQRRIKNTDIKHQKDNNIIIINNTIPSRGWDGVGWHAGMHNDGDGMKMGKDAEVDVLARLVYL
jgi:hypothetical protein